MRTVRTHKLRSTLLLLAGGFACAFVIAIACSILAQVGSSTVVPMTDDEIWALAHRLHLAPSEGVYTGATGHLKGLGYREYRMTTPAVSFAGGNMLGPVPWTIREIEAGWPLRCVRHAVAIKSDLSPQLFTKTPVIINLDADRITLPLRPIWSKFVLNSLIYAALGWLICFAPGIVRRRFRARGGRCPGCGFIIAPGTCANGLCSECGATLPWMKQTST